MVPLKKKMTICDATHGLAVSNHLQGVFVFNVENQVVHKMFQCPFFMDQVHAKL